MQARLSAQVGDGAECSTIDPARAGMEVEMGVSIPSASSTPRIGCSRRLVGIAVLASMVLVQVP